MRVCLIALSLLLVTLATPARALVLAFEMTFTSADGLGTVLGEGSASGAGTFDVAAGEIVLGPGTWTWLPATSGVGPAITFGDWTHTLTGSASGGASFVAVDPDLVFTTLAPRGVASQAYTGTIGAILHTVAVDFTVVPEPRGLPSIALGASWLALCARRRRRR